MLACMSKSKSRVWILFVKGGKEKRDRDRYSEGERKAVVENQWTSDNEIVIEWRYVACQSRKESLAEHDR